MKVFSLVAAASLFIYACNNSNNTSSTTVQSDTTTNAAEAAYTPEEGDVSYRDGNVYVWRNNEWQEAHGDVRLDNGAVVHSDGHIEKESKTVVLDDGEVVNKSGNFFDKAGHAINKGWDETKDAANTAGKKIKKGAKKVGEEVKDVFNGDDKKGGKDQ